MKFGQYHKLCTFCGQILYAGDIAGTVGVDILAERMLDNSCFYLFHLLWYLHRGTMKRTVLKKQSPAVYRNDVMIRERYPDCLAGKKVVGRLIINRHEQISFRHEIIRVRGWQPVPLGIENRIRQR